MRSAILLFIVLFSACAQKIARDENANQFREKPKVIIPKRQEPVSLEKGIDWSAEQGGLSKLRDAALPDGDFEIRFWTHAGVGARVGTNGLIIKKSGENRSAFNVDKMFLKGDEKNENHLVFPKSDWKILRQKLDETGIFTLPDSSELKNYKGDDVLDGFEYTVEINKDKIYRVYSYSNPNAADNPEAKQIVQIGDILADEFGIKEIKADPY